MTLSGLNPVAALSDIVRTRGRGLKNALARGYPARWIVLDGWKNAFARRRRNRWIVFDSDDWGSQRVPSRGVLEALIGHGILTGTSPYDYDTLESAEDLTALLEVLGRAKGADGRAAVFSCYANPANPDFAAIRDNGFSAYVWEPVSATLARRGDRVAVQAAWRQGMAAGLLAPQYHGREHLQAGLWMEHLRQSPLVRRGFELGFYSVPQPGLPQAARGFRAANFFMDDGELPKLEEIIRSGAECFAAEFGRRAEIYGPTNNIFHPALYPAVAEAGCRAVIRHVRNAQPDGRGGLRRVWGHAGVSEAGLDWFGRNTLFEPALGYGVDHALAGITSAFAWGVPAVISTHRVNYVGGIDPGVRDRGLRGLQALLSEIARRWPDASFVPSTRLLTSVNA